MEDYKYLMECVEGDIESLEDWYLVQLTKHIKACKKETNETNLKYLMDCVEALNCFVEGLVETYQEAQNTKE